MGAIGRVKMVTETEGEKRRAERSVGPTPGLFCIGLGWLWSFELFPPS